MSALEDRLTAGLRAESELIKPESLAGLSLPGLDRSGRRGRRGRRAGRWWPPWLAPLAAAAAALAAVAGALTAARLFSGPSAQQPAAPAPSRLPAYYAVTISGNVVSYTSGGNQYSSSVLGRSIQIRATATGNLVTTVRPPAQYNNFAVLTGTTMPAILTEISFVSSPADEHNLQTEAYRQQIAEALYKGIARYEESAPRAKVAKLIPGATGR